MLVCFLGVYDYGIFFVVWIFVIVFGVMVCVGFLLFVNWFIFKYRNFGDLFYICGFVKVGCLLVFVIGVVVVVVGILVICLMILVIEFVYV